MSKKWLPLVIILVLAVILILIRRSGLNNSSVQGNYSGKKTNDPASAPNRDHGFDRRVSYIEYTEHAKCRMECRKISQAEVEQVMRDGKINYKKTDVNSRPCPAYALEAVTADNQRVRIVFAQCDQKTKVVTCIDLDKEWECHCPGDDNKYKNKK